MKLAASELHLWLAFDRELAEERLLASFTALLDATERERAARLRTETLAQQFLVTRALQRTVLSCYAPEIAPAEWRFVVGERGKPEVAPDLARLGLQFNVSHATGLVVMAVTRGGQVGVDVENLVDRAAPLALATRYFTAGEARHLMDLPAAQQQRHFYRLWTLKEAWLKATARGVAHGLADISFGFDAAGEVENVVMPGEGPAHWQFWQGQPGEHHLAAVAARNSWSPLTMAVFRRLPSVELSYQSLPALPLVAGASGEEQRAQS